jgi:uncharacterized protein (TIGR02147 family)
VNFFKHEHYRPLLRSLVEEQKKHPVIRLTYQALAEEIHVQKSYLSRVIAEQAELNADQIYLATKALRLDANQSRFFILLAERDRSALKERREELTKEIARLREESLKTQSHMDDRIVVDDSQKLLNYYLDPLHQVVHIALSVKDLGRKWEILSQLLQIPETKLREVLRRLEDYGLVKFQNGEYAVTSRNLHLPKENPLYPFYLDAIRSRATERLRLISGPSTYAFSAVFSADAATRENIQKNFLVFLKQAQGDVSKAPAEGVYQMNFDLFPWIDAR